MGLFEELGLDNYSISTDAQRYTQEYFPINDIVNGIICLKDNRFIRILEILPSNFESKNIKEKDDISHDFMRWLTIAPVDIQIKIVTERTNPSEMINELSSYYNKTGDAAISNYISHYASLIYSLSASQASIKRFYMIITYEPKHSSKKNPTIYDIEQELDVAIRTISSYMKACENIVLPVGDKDTPKLEVLEILYKMFNPRSYAETNSAYTSALENRIFRLQEDYKKISNEQNPKLFMHDILAPMEVDLSHPDCVVIDGMYHTYLLVSGDGYPIKTQSGWYSGYFSLGVGETVDMFIHRESKSKFIKEVSRRIKFNAVKVSEKNETHSDYEKASRALESARYLKYIINNAGEDPFYLTTLITLTAYRYEDLIRRKEQIIDFYQSRDIKILSLKYLQEEAMKSSFPFLKLSNKLYLKGRRNIMTSGLGSCYPFVSSEMHDKHGVLMGISARNNSLCVLNPFERKTYKNANMVILGTSGAGKTYTEQLVALRMRAKGTQCFILAPDKAHEFQRACTFGVDGEFIKIAASSNDHINILDIRPSASETMDMLQGEEATNNILISEKASTVVTFLSLLIPDLQNEEEQIIDTAVIRTYAKYGITEDNDSIYIDPHHPEKGLKEMPIIEDLYKEIEKIGGGERVLKIMNQFITGSYKSFNHRTNVNLDNKYIVFDLSKLQGRFLPAGMFIALDFITSRIREDVTEEKMVFIDEGWQLIGSGANEKAAEYVKWLFKIIRGYNGGACIATQDIKDFFSLKDGEYGNAILSNSQIKMILNMNPNEAEFVQNELRLSPEEIRSIKNFERGQCLVCANSNHIAINIIGSDYETDLITTNPDDIRKVVDKMKRNGGVLL